MRWLNLRRVLTGLLLGVLMAAGWQILPVLLGPEIDGMPVTRGDLVQVISLPGQLQLAEKFEITATQSGKIATVAVNAGESVKVGQVLLNLENARERSQLAEAKKSVALAQLRFKQAKEKLRTGSDRAVDQANTSLNNSKKQYARISDLAARGLVSQTQAADALRNLAITQTQLKNAQFQAKASRAQGSEYALADSALKNARELEKTAQHKLEGTVLRSMNEGVVTSSLVQPGQSVKTGMVVMQMASADYAQVKLNLAEDSVRLAKPGAPIKFNNIELGKMPEDFDTNQAEASLVFKLDAALPILQQDKPLQLQIEVAQLHDVLSIDVTAIHDAQSAQPWVMLVRDDKAQRRAIRTGAIGRIGTNASVTINSNPRMQVMEGLQEGDIVLPATVQNIEEGRRIRLARNG